MRVIAGRAKGYRLRSVPGNSTRPITDRAKEALFSILGDWIVDRRALDLFGGAGSVGIEALSRGAAHVHFIDHSRAAIRTMRQNLAHCNLADRATVERRDSFNFIERFAQREAPTQCNPNARQSRAEPFDLIYIAPPQYQELWRAALLAVDARPHLLTGDGVVVVQIHPREETPSALETLREFDRRRYGSVLLIFYECADESDCGQGVRDRGAG